MSGKRLIQCFDQKSLPFADATGDEMVEWTVQALTHRSRKHAVNNFTSIIVPDVVHGTTAAVQDSDLQSAANTLHSRDDSAMLLFPHKIEQYEQHQQGLGLVQDRYDGDNPFIQCHPHPT
ncbi:unnamed protein product [Mucor fragilis]